MKLYVISPNFCLNSKKKSALYAMLINWPFSKSNYFYTLQHKLGVHLIKTIILSLLLCLPLTLFADKAKFKEQYEDLGINNIDHIKKGLLNNGVSESEIDPVLRGMIRLIMSVKADGKVLRYTICY